jgi:preprotein translocase subunit YajC
MEALIAQLLPLVLLFAVFYFLLIRPQRNRQQQQRSLLGSLSRNDRVVTIGGFHGTIQSVDDETVRLEIAPGTVATLAKAAIARRLIDADSGDLGASAPHEPE